MIDTSRIRSVSRRKTHEHHPVLKVSSGGLYIGGVHQMAPLDRFRASLARARVDALIAARRAEALALAGGDELVGADEAAKTLGVSIDHIRLLFRTGQVLGAFREGRLWWVRKRDLWAYQRLEAPDQLRHAS